MQASSIDDPRPFRLVLAGVVALLLLLLGFAGAKSYQDLETARREQRELEGHIEATRTSIERLKHRIERLEKDPDTLERLAREELWMARPDDVVIVLPAEGEAPVPPVDR